MKKLLPLLAGSVLALVASAPVQAQTPGNSPRDNGNGPGFGGPGFGNPGFGGPPRGGAFGPGSRRGPRAKGELTRLWRGLGAVEKSASPLSKAQATKVVALMLPVSKTQTLSDANALKLSGQIRGILTPAQLALLTQRRGPGNGGPRGAGPGNGGPGNGGPGNGGPGFGGPRNGGPENGGPGFGGPGNGGPRGQGFGGDGPGGGGQGRMGSADFEKTRAFMDANNPFYPPTGYANWKALPTTFQKNVARRWGENRALLEALSRKAKGK